MGRYTLRRLLQMIPVVLGTTFLIYVATWSLPGDPFAGKCGQRPCPPSYVEAQTERLNLNDNVFVQYFKYMKDLLTGNLGETFSGESVATLVGDAFPITVRLTLLAVVFTLFIGISLGILSALRRGGLFDNGILVLTLLVISVPIFVVGFLAQFIFGVKLGWFPVTVGPEAPWEDLVLPAIVLASVSLAFTARLMRASLAEAMSSDHVRTAKAKGLPRRTVIMKHGVRNSLIPVITFIGADFGVLLGGAIVTEGIFNIAGIGGLTYQAIRLREGATVVAVTTLIVLVFLVVNLLVDLLYAVLDPRIRYE
jgi:oligopeptide transport system permease protein